MPGTNLFDAMPDGLSHAILSSIRDPFNVIDKKYRILWANEARARFHQQNLRDMIGRYCYEMFQRRSEPCSQCPVRVVFDSGKPCVVERPVSLPDGSSKWSNVRVYPVFDKKGNVVYAVKILIDITKGKLIGARQKRHVELLENTIQAMNRKNVRNFFQDEGGTSKGILTGREIEVLGLISNGLSNVKIGEILDISPHTVKSHVMNIFDKLGVKGRTQAAVWTVRNQLN